MIQILTSIRLFAFVLALVFSSHASAQQILSASGLDAWLKAYKEAWETRNADKAASLFTAQATYQENPYEAPFQGRQAIKDYWAGVTADQQDISFSYELVAVSGNTGVAHWHADFSSRSSGAAIMLDGVFVLEFDEQGLCESLREWWQLKLDE